MPTTLPPIGQPWPGLEGSLYAGKARGQDGQPDHHLVLLADKPATLLNWKTAISWAESLGAGAALPTRDESALLYAFLREHFETNDWYWTSSQYSAGSAWSQYFDYGGQYDYDKRYEVRARAVRRFDAQSFNPLTQGG